MPFITARESFELRREAARRSLAKRRFDCFLLTACHGAYRHSPHTRLICRKLEEILSGEGKRLMLFLPPRHGKSMTVTESFPAYFLLRNPDKRIIITSYGKDLAQRFGNENLKKFKELGPPLFGLDVSGRKSSMTAWDVEGRRGGLLSTTILGGMTGHGADLLVIDDPVKNSLEASSALRRNRIHSEYSSSIRTRLNKGASVILIQTRWHEDDLAGRLIRSADEPWDQLALPAVCEEEGDPIGRAVGDPLCPGLGFGLEWAEQTRRAVGSRVWSALYQQRPSVDEGQIFKRGWWRYYKEPPAGLDEIIMSVDCAFKGDEGSDFVVAQVWGRAGGLRYLLDQTRGRLTFGQTLAAIRALSQKWPRAYKKLIEDKANGSAVIDVLQKEMAGVVGVDPKGGKVVRANAASPAVESGNVLLPMDAPWINDFVDELSEFPNSAHDDQVDAMTQAMAHFNSAPTWGYSIDRR
jgi:predicted phage terminase large subunit-like protein